MPQSVFPRRKHDMYLIFCFLNAFQHLLKCSTFGRFLVVLDFFLHMFVAIFGNISELLLLHLNCFTGIRLICFFFGRLQVTSQHVLSSSKLSLFMLLSELSFSIGNLMGKARKVFCSILRVLTLLSS